MSLLWIACVYALLSLGITSNPECEELTKPLDLTEQAKIHGKWYVLASTGKGSTHLEKMSSSWFEITSTGEEGKVNLRWGDRVNGKCLHGTLDGTVSGNKASMVFEGVLHTGEYFQSCSNCLVFLDTSSKNDVSSRYLYLSKREADLKDSDLETLKKQAECLNVSPTVLTYGATDLCPNEEAEKQ